MIGFLGQIEERLAKGKLSAYRPEILGILGFLRQVKDVGKCLMYP
jgi:hypothetical protein